MSPEKEFEENLRTERNLREEMMTRLKSENEDLKRKNAVKTGLLFFLAYLSMMSVKSCHDHKRDTQELFDESRLELTVPEEKVLSAEEQAKKTREEDACHELKIDYRKFTELRDRYQK